MVKRIIRSAGSLPFAAALRRAQLDSKYFVRDFKNIAIYGSSAPRSFECIWVNPYDCELFLPIDSVAKMTGTGHRKSTAMVVTGHWDQKNVIPFTEMNKFNFCFQHWFKGIPWEQTGAYEELANKIRKSGKKIDNCKTERDIEQRYSNLDEIYRSIQIDGYFKKKKEMNPANFREKGGVLIHLGPDGKLFFGNTGSHRLSIALLLGLYLPVTIGCVHETALDYLCELRKKKSGRPVMTEHYRAFFENENIAISHVS